MRAYDYTMRAIPHVSVLERNGNARALELLSQALIIDSEYPLALSLAGWCYAQLSVYNWAEFRDRGVDMVSQNRRHEYVLVVPSSERR
jgi:hypothetical protein